MVWSILCASALVFTIPIALAGGVAASAATTTGMLAAVGLGDMQIGVGTAALIGALAAGAIIGSCYGTIKLYNSIEVRNELKKMNPDMLALYLSILAIYW